MEGDSAELKEDSFEILPHLSEYELFTDIQKYRFFSKYGHDVAASETNSISTSNVWNISEIEFYDLKNPYDSGEESDTILKPCSLEASAHVESGLNPMTQEVVLFNNTVGNPGSNMMQMNNIWKFESEDKVDLEFELNNTRIVEIVSDNILSTINNDNTQILNQSSFTYNDSDNSLQLEDPQHNSGRLSKNALLTEDPMKNTTVQVYRGRSKSSKRICEAMNNSLKFCKWLQRNRIISRVLEGAKSSFNSFVNMFELDLNQTIRVKEKPLELAIVAEKSHCKAIENAFSEIFSSGVSFISVNPGVNSIAVLPVGHVAGVQVAEIQIQCARRKNINTTMVSTSTLIHEAVPQRWQMTTVICLDDPKLQLKMHNFTVSIPIPNEYVTEAARWTPCSHISDNSGFAINIEQAISNLVPVAVKDAQEFLTGCDSYTTLKSAALCLAGMYRKYIISPLLDVK